MKKIKSNAIAAEIFQIECVSNNYFGSTLKEFRIKRNLTQEDVSKKLNVTQAQLSAYETGKSNPNLDTLISIAIILKVNPLELVESALSKSKYFKDMPSDYEPSKIVRRVSRRRLAKNLC